MKILRAVKKVKSKYRNARNSRIPWINRGVNNLYSIMPRNLSE